MQFANQIELVVEDWRALERRGRIKSFELAFHEFQPTEYQVVFDGRSLVTGLYDWEPEDYSGVGVRKVMVFDSGSDSGKAVIDEYTERFDHLFETCVRRGPKLP